MLLLVGLTMTNIYKRNYPQTTVIKIKILKTITFIFVVYYFLLK